MGDRRAAALVFLVACVAYANSLGNGFAFDDLWFIVENPVVTEARFGEAFSRAAWPGAVAGTGNYRPLALSSFALEWRMWGDAPLGYHAVSVLAHALVSLLVLALLTRAVPTPAALTGALFFAVHPVHTEAVANVMGRAELYAALGYLGACLTYLTWRPSAAGLRGLRLVVILALYLVAVGSKEIGVTLPATLVALELSRRGEEPLVSRLRREAVVYAAALLVMACYVLVRWNALGDVTGESAAAGLLTLTPRERILTALTVWPHYLRLLVFPVDLVADYGPDVLVMTTSVTAAVVFGAVLLIGTVAGACLLWRRAPVVALGLAWFVIAISPVSNLFVRADVLLAERTLYLPSVGAALVVAAVAVRVLDASPRVSRMSAPIAVTVGVLLMARTIDRNPAWHDTFTMLSVLAAEHPESWLSHRSHAIGLEGVEEYALAAERYESAISIAPDHYQLLVDAAVFHFDHGSRERAEELLLDAIALKPDHTEAYRRLAEHRLLTGRGREAHAVALQGLRRATDHRLLWGALSESYVLKGDFVAAVRARTTALTRDPDSASGWRRLAELYDALHLAEEAGVARDRAAELEPSALATPR